MPQENHIKFYKLLSIFCTIDILWKFVSGHKMGIENLMNIEMMFNCSFNEIPFFINFELFTLWLTALNSNEMS